MAEDTALADIGEEGAPAEPSSENADHPAELSTPLTRADLSELAAYLDDRFSQHSQQWFRGIQSHLDGSIAEIRKQFGVTREQAEYLKSMAAVTLGEDEVKGIAARSKEADIEARERALAEAERRRQANPAQVDPQAAADAHYVSQFGPKAILTDYAQEQGLNYDEIERMMPPRLGDFITANDRTGWRGWIRAARATIDKIADKKAQESKARVRADITAPAGSTRGKRFTLDDALNVNIRERGFKQVKDETEAMLDQMFARK